MHHFNMFSFVSAMWVCMNEFVVFAAIDWMKEANATVSFHVKMRLLYIFLVKMVDSPAKMQ